MPKRKCKKVKSGKRSYKKIHAKEPKEKHKKKATGRSGAAAVAGPGSSS